MVSEDPELHLVRINNRIFIKPLPAYVLSYAFWEFYFHVESLPERERSRRHSIWRAALGYMRISTHLVRHESDYYIAQEARLIPAEVTWEDIMAFIAHFRDIEDDQVSPRYRYGRCSCCGMVPSQHSTYRLRSNPVGFEYCAFLRPTFVGVVKAVKPPPQQFYSFRHAFQ